MNAITNLQIGPGIYRLDLTAAEITYVETEAALLPWRWNVWETSMGEGTPSDPYQTYVDIEPADGEDVPYWLPMFSIMRTATGYSITVYAKAPSTTMPDTLEADSAAIEVCENLAVAFRHIPKWLAATLQGWGLASIAATLPIVSEAA